MHYTPPPPPPPRAGGGGGGRVWFDLRAEDLCGYGLLDDYRFGVSDDLWTYVRF